MQFVVTRVARNEGLVSFFRLNTRALRAPNARVRGSFVAAGVRAIAAGARCNGEGQVLETQVAYSPLRLALHEYMALIPDEAERRKTAPPVRQITWPRHANEEDKP